MRFENFLLSLALCLIGVVGAAAQTITITGNVLDDKGQPLVGAMVTLNNSADGATIVNLDGNYQLVVRDNIGRTDSIVFTFVGYQRVAKAYEGKRVINVTMKDEVVHLDDLVVTALGITRQEKSLGYSTQTVSGEEILKSRPSNWTLALQGEVAGLKVTSSGGPISSTKISLRGDASLNQDGNSAMIVVDGVPLSSPMNNPGVAYGAGGDSDLSIDYGNGFSDLNPDDIESIQVLKGASASALYGSRAANGVVLVTTKSGKREQKGWGVDYSMNMSFDRVAHWPDFQYDFGQGESTYIGETGSEYEGQQYYFYASHGKSYNAWGAKFDGQYFYQYDPSTESVGTTKTLWRPQWL